ncbi:6,7-dimethyl-8-ribityllumazine synthase [Allostella humosa]|nr:6,7-dimethyl-8-ribityllumazine synthase [Stella humosa]BBK31817.1 6,7-dimethyl-8-ribityllumazine synthase [Stella humosa]
MKQPHILIVEARFYDDLADELVKGAVGRLAAAGATHDRISVPGAFEIPAAIAFAERAGRAVASATRYDGYVALGCVIRGETTHYDYVCGESARGLQDLAVRDGLAIGYGILTVENGAQAWARARVSEKNKGGDAATACLAMIELKRKLGLRS